MRFLIPLVAGLLTALFPGEAFATVAPCPIPFLPCGSGGAIGASTFVRDTIVPAMRVLFVGIAAGMFFYYGALLLLESGEEQKVSEVKGAYQYVITGAALVSLASLIVGSVGTNNPVIAGAGANIVNVAAACTTMDNIVFSLKVGLAMIATLHVTIQGIRLIVLMGNEGELEKQKKRFLYGLMGIVMILLANPIVNAVMPNPGCLLGGAGSGSLASELVGFANFLLTIIGGAILLSFIAGGAILVVSTNDALKDRAKKTIFGSVVGLILVLVSFVVIRYFLGL